MLVTPSRQHRWALGGRACAVGCHGSPLGGTEKNGNLHAQLQEFEAQQKEFQIRSYPKKNPQDGEDLSNKISPFLE